MASSADVRRIALALPGTSGHVSWGMPTFKVGTTEKSRKILLSLDEAEEVLGFAIDPDERMALIAAAPGTYFLRTGHDEGFGWARARLDRLDVEELSGLVEDAWRRVAPPKVRRLRP